MFVIANREKRQATHSLKQYRIVLTSLARETDSIASPNNDDNDHNDSDYDYDYDDNTEDDDDDDDDGTIIDFRGVVQ